ncbi:aminoglycoside 6-adenylyltransferase [Virgibacillus doumboii]|uniref:aminoglycoside 6-adenylyltransferase n=1 Tax=Virgibacillus doumboii TaxID=2697503 RepID=UPI0013E0B4E3|nr:aminoglycoside 6-adenylyltransferase [Virgibacillus doumboii]
MGLDVKYSKRDLELPRYRKELQDNIENDLCNDNNVLAVFYGGSIGNQNTDLFSDIDIRVVVKEEVFEEYRQNKKLRAVNWGNVLFYEGSPATNFIVAHYDCFIKVDSFYYQPSHIRPSVWLKNIKIVHDTNGFMSGIQSESASLIYSPTSNEVEFWCTKFFAHFHEVYRRVQRGEIYYALHCVDQMRLAIVSGWYMDAGVHPNTLGDWANLEGERSKLNQAQSELLESWDCGRSPDEIMGVAKSMIPEFRHIHSSLCEKVGINKDSKWLDNVFNQVLQEESR